MFARIFLSPDELHPGRRRLRAGWRILFQIAIMTTLGLVVGIVFTSFALLVPAFEPYRLIPLQLGSFIAINTSIYLARRFLDRRSMVSLGLQISRQAVWDVLAGFLIAGVILLMVYFIERAAGWLTVQGFAWQRLSIQDTLLMTLAMLFLFVIVGWQEELLARGYVLQNIAEGTSLSLGLLLSSLFFALGHYANPNVGLIPVAGLFLAGLFMGYAYLRTRRLWLPIGLHIGWNFFEGPVLGFPVSGLNLFGLISHTNDGPVLFTGGAFGPEAGLVLLPALALGTILVYYYTRYESG